MKISEIVAKLTKYSEAYYKGEEIVDDATFDALEDELRKLDPKNEYFNHLREKSGYGTKIKHRYEFIGSLDKIHSVEESELLHSPVILSAKLDGASLVTYFTDGKLDYSVTRGDGEFGMDVTQHYLAITKKYELSIPEHFTGAVRGEVVFTNSNWQKFKALHPEAKAPRNSGTGLINQKTVCAEEELSDFVVYDIVATNIPVPNDLSLLEQFGYPIAPHTTVTSPINETMLELFTNWKQTYPIDGIVIRQVSNQLTSNSSIYHYTKNQEAFKFQAELKLCKVRKIEWQLGRTGKLTPVLRIEPVEMSGAIVSRITAHNAANVQALHLGKGAEILAYRSGEVIPTIKDIVTPADEVIIPTHCPYCGSKLEYSPTAKDIYCTYDECEGKDKFKVFNFIEVICSDVKGIGDSFLEAFLAELQIDQYPRSSAIARFICAIKTKRNSQFSTLGTADNKIANQVIETILSPVLPAEKFWLSLGIRLLGNESAKRLAANNSEILAIISYQDREYLREALALTLPGQNVLALNVLTAMNDIREINAELSCSFSTPTTTNRYYAITGSLSKSRKAIQEEFLAHSWEMTENLAKAELLITNTPESNSSKNQKARQLGKQVLSEEEFRIKYL